MYIDDASLRKALARLHGTADHMIKIWFTLKQMGLREGLAPIVVTTANPTDSLKRLFDFGSANGEFFVPFAHTERFKTMMGDAGRSIIQTTVQRWNTSNSVVTSDPTHFLDFSEDANGDALVGTARSYPIGLGIDKRGFALKDGMKSSIPANAFAIWYFRQTDLTQGEISSSKALVGRMMDELGVSQAEFQSVFQKDSFDYTFSPIRLTDAELLKACNEYTSRALGTIVQIIACTPGQQERMVRSMKTISSGPSWLNTSPDMQLEGILAAGEKAVLLYGPPRTGKTRAISKLLEKLEVPHDQSVYIQIHSGWTYDNLMEMFAPNSSGVWEWRKGPLLDAIQQGKKYIVLEEINRTNFSQALGEVFSLIENSYRGEKYAIKLRSGQEFSLPADVVFLFTMNTIDKSTEDVDDALFGRIAAVEYPPRIEDLAALLSSTTLDEDICRKCRTLFASIQEKYPLGHGYFSDFKNYGSLEIFYQARIRPVLHSHFHAFDRDVLTNIDNVVDGLISE